MLCTMFYYALPCATVNVSCYWWLGWDLASTATPSSPCHRPWIALIIKRHLKRNYKETTKKVYTIKLYNCWFNIYIKDVQSIMIFTSPGYTGWTSTLHSGWPFDASSASHTRGTLTPLRSRGLRLNKHRARWSVLWFTGLHTGSGKCLAFKCEMRKYIISFTF